MSSIIMANYWSRWYVRLNYYCIDTDLYVFLSLQKIISHFNVTSSYAWKDLRIFLSTILFPSEKKEMYIYIRAKSVYKFSINYTYFFHPFPNSTFVWKIMEHEQTVWNHILELYKFTLVKWNPEDWNFFISIRWQWECINSKNEHYFKKPNF